MPGEERGRDWSHVARSQKTPGAIISWKRQLSDSPLEPPEGVQPCQHLGFGFLASRIV